jgi:hypothetical protein
MRLALVAGFWLALVACAPIKVVTDYKPEAAPRMAAYKTYTWLPQPTGPDTRIYNDITNGRLQGSVDRYLASRGYQKAAADAPADFAIGWQGSVDQELSITTVNSYYGYGYGGGWYGYGPYGPAMGGYSDTTVSTYDVGTLILDIVDTASNELVWRGVAEAELMHYEDPEKRQERLDRAITEILQEFPPAAATP